MDVESLRTYCLSKKGTTEDLPFGEDTLVFRVMGKIYALIGLKSERQRVNLKCDPDRALQLRDQYPEIVPGYHMNKKHWNTVYLEGDLGNSLIRDMVDHSYELVARGLKKSDRDKLAGLE